MSTLHDSVILFYLYAPIVGQSDDKNCQTNLLEAFRALQVDLASKLQLRGRLLIGGGQSEGLNGTFSGCKAHLDIYVAVMSNTWSNNGCAVESGGLLEAVGAYEEGIAHLRKAGLCEFHIPPSEFKWSENKTKADIFPDLNIKVVDEIVGTGGKLAGIPLSATSKGYLTPAEFHRAVEDMHMQEDPSTVLIDCRNSKEVAVGKFVSALDPKTKTFFEYREITDTGDGRPAI